MAKPKKKEPQKAEKKEKASAEDSEWDEDWDDSEDEIIEEDDGDGSPPTKGFIKIRDLREGMTDVNVEAVVDFVGQTYGKEYGEKPYAVSFIKDETGEVKITFWADDIKKAKKGRKVRVMHANVTAYRGQLQVNPNRKTGVDFP